MKTTYVTKKRKCEELTRQIQRMWRTKDERMVPIMTSSTGLVHKRLAKNLKMMELGDGILIGRIQKAVIIKNCCMERKFLGEMEAFASLGS